MSNLAFVFPGQGSQSVGMGRALTAASPAAAAVFAAADEALGEPISALAWVGPEDQLNLTENAQPALLATSIAYLAAARERAAAKGRKNIQAWFQKQVDTGAANLKLSPFASRIAGDLAFEAGT